jgi:two-component system, NarL family, nitrate/nitrite response regulator NarL
MGIPMPFVRRQRREGVMRTVVVGDRQEIFGAGIQALLQAGSSYTVVARCSHTDGLVTALRTHGPTLVVIGESLLQTSKFVLIEFLTNPDHPGRVIVLFDKANQTSLSEVIALGVHGIILKETAAERLLECVHQVGSGERWIDPNLLPCLLDPTVSPISKRLSSRETDVSRHVSQGLRNKEIARRMDISEATVKMHLHHIYEKLHINSRMELALMANLQPGQKPVQVASPPAAVNGAQFDLAARRLVTS